MLSFDTSLYSAVKQRLKWNTGKVFNYFNQFLLTVVLSNEELVYLVEYVLREGSRRTDLVREQFAEKFPETPVPHRNAAKSAGYRDRPRTLNELKPAITVYIRNISQADLHKVFANKIRWVQACMDTRGHHLQHLL